MARPSRRPTSAHPLPHTYFTPLRYRSLAESCWAEDAAARPPLPAITAELRRLQAVLCGGPPEMHAGRYPAGLAPEAVRKGRMLIPGTAPRQTFALVPATQPSPSPPSTPPSPAVSSVATGRRHAYTRSCSGGFSGGNKQPIMAAEVDLSGPDGRMMMRAMSSIKRAPTEHRLAHATTAAASPGY